MGIDTVLMVYIFPILFVVGVVGNTLNLMVLLDKRMRSKTNILLSVMALADIFFLVFMMVHSLMYHADLMRNSVFRIFVVYSGPHITGIINMCSFISAWIIVLVSVERMTAVMWPLRARSFWTCSTIKILILTVIIMSFVVSLHSHITHEVIVFARNVTLPQATDSPNVTTLPLRTVERKVLRSSLRPGMEAYWRYATLATAVFVVFVPVLAVIGTNALVFCALRAQNNASLVASQKSSVRARRSFDSSPMNSLVEGKRGTQRVGDHEAKNNNVVHPQPTEDRPAVAAKRSLQMQRNGAGSFRHNQSTGSLKAPTTLPVTYEERSADNSAEPGPAKDSNIYFTLANEDPKLDEPATKPLRQLSRGHASFDETLPDTPDSSRSTRRSLRAKTSDAVRSCGSNRSSHRSGGGADYVQRRANGEYQQMLHKGESGEARSRQKPGSSRNQRRATFIVFIIASTFTISQTPSALIHICEIMWPWIGGYSEFKTGATLTNSLVVTGKTMNLFLFCMWSSHFRRNLQRILASKLPFAASLVRETARLGRFWRKKQLASKTCSTKPILMHKQSVVESEAASTPVVCK